MKTQEALKVIQAALREPRPSEKVINELMEIIYLIRVNEDAGDDDKRATWRDFVSASGKAISSLKQYIAEND